MSCMYSQNHASFTLVLIYITHSLPSSLGFCPFTLTKHAFVRYQMSPMKTLWSEVVLLSVLGESALDV